MFEVLNNFSTITRNKEFYDSIISLIVLFTIVMTGARRLETIVRLFALQSFGLVIIILISGITSNNPGTYFLAGLTFLGKCILIPWFLMNVLEKVKIRREVETYMGLPASMLLACGITATTFYLTRNLDIAKGVTSLSLLSVSISMFLIGLFIMITRKKALAQILGLYIMENGIFTLIIDTVFEMPIIVEMGIFLDLLIGVLVMGVWVYRIKQSFDTINVEELQKLRG